MYAFTRKIKDFEPLTFMTITSWFTAQETNFFLRNENECDCERPRDSVKCANLAFCTLPV